MILENMILDNVKNMPPSGIRKYFDLINGGCYFFRGWGA